MTLFEKGQEVVVTSAYSRGIWNRKTTAHGTHLTHYSVDLQAGTVGTIHKRIKRPNKYKERYDYYVRFTGLLASPDKLFNYESGPSKPVDLTFRLPDTSLMLPEVYISRRFAGE